MDRGHEKGFMLRMAVLQRVVIMAVKVISRSPAHYGLALMALLMAGLVTPVCAQNYSAYPAYNPYYSQPYTPPAPPVAPSPPFYAPGVYGPPVMATPQIVAPLSAGQIDELAAPIALYPDALLAQLLPASTYPQQVALAAQWLQYNPNPSEIVIAMQNWDASIKAMVHYPTVLQYMNTNLQWTEALGVAFLNQQASVMQAIQQLRAQAVAAGTLQSTPQQQVISQNGTIWIEPANPQMMYVPQYDPSLVYSQQPGNFTGTGLTFSFGFAIGSWLNNNCDWQNNWISAGQNWDHDWRRDNRGQWIRARPVYRGNDQRFGPVRTFPQRWRRNTREPLPALPPNLVQPGALRQYRGWPGYSPTNRPNRGFRPGNNRPNFTPQPPPRMFGGNYRSDNNVIRAENRGRQSLRRSHSQWQPRPGTHPTYRAPQSRQRQVPPAFQGMNSRRQVQQDRQRGRQSMRRR